MARLAFTCFFILGLFAASANEPAVDATPLKDRIFDAGVESAISDLQTALDPKVAISLQNSTIKIYEIEVAVRGLCFQIDRFRIFFGDEPWLLFKEDVERLIVKSYTTAVTVEAFSQGNTPSSASQIKVYAKRIGVNIEELMVLKPSPASVVTVSSPHHP